MVEGLKKLVELDVLDAKRDLNLPHCTVEGPLARLKIKLYLLVIAILLICLLLNIVQKNVLYSWIQLHPLGPKASKILLTSYAAGEHTIVLGSAWIRGRERPWGSGV